MRAPPTHSTAREKADLPLPPPVRPVATERIQRQPDDGEVSLAEGIGTVSGSVGVIQRIDVGAPADTQSSGGGGGQDLERLARDVYPYLKRLLAAERERTTGRWR